MPNTLYVAETDDQNAIAAVWVKPGGARIARVFDPGKSNFDPSEDAQFSGAPEAVIRQWLLQRQAIATTD
ncbi:MAG: hypothetical protein AAGP08_01890 [Pseudomonadota bacterium]